MRKGPRVRPVEDRLWEKVDIQGLSNCWEWLAHKGPNGYGRLQVNGKVQKAHRVAWALTYGEIPAGMFVCHHCDNRACINPNHLFLTDNAGNLADMVAKGRSQRGERNGRSKLTEGQVLEIRRLRKETRLTRREIGKMFGVCEGTVSRIGRRTHWTHI